MKTIYAVREAESLGDVVLFIRLQLPFNDGGFAFLLLRRASCTTTARFSPTEFDAASCDISLYF